jgi:hypothetical protein
MNMTDGNEPASAESEGESPVKDERTVDISFEVTPEDCRAADLHARRRLMARAIPSWAATLYFSIILFASILAVLLIFGAAGRRSEDADSLLLVLALFLFLVVFLIMYVWRRIALSRINRMAAAVGGSRCGPVRVVLKDGILRRISRIGESTLYLDAVREVAVVDGVILLYLDSISYFFVPRRAFPEGAVEEAFISLLRKDGAVPRPAPSDRGTGRVEPEPTMRDEAGSLPAQGHDGTEASARTGCMRNIRKVVSGTLTNIRLGIRTTFFLRVEPGELKSSGWGFTSLALFDFFLDQALAIARIGPSGHFSAYSLPSAVIHIPLMLFAGLWIARTARRDELALPLATCWLAVGIPLSLLAAFLNACMENDWLRIEKYVPDFEYFYPFFGWWVLASLVATLRMIGATTARRFAAAAIFAATLVFPLMEVQKGELWSESVDDSSTENMAKAGSEETFYRQPVLLETALDGLQPGRKGVEELYFVGFAGYGSQDVFRKELEVIGRLFQARFDTAGRSLLLVNNPATVLKYPIATATALERALKKVGQVMDRDEDILVLYLTSHGSEDHRLSAELWPLTLRDIDPAMLRRMLDESGIRWRVIIVSACYSGGFIEALKDEGTLVMTASDASSNSFGCSNDSDFTWFGKAVFDEELRRTYSFTTAFTRASASIAAREAKEGENPSNPQMYLGSAIRSRLRRVEERLEKLEREHRRPRGGDSLAMRTEATRCISPSAVQ